MKALIPRFFVPSALATGMLVSLPEKTAHHAARVLRMVADDALILFNGTGGEYHGKLASVGKSQVAVTLQSFVDTERESPLRTTLIQALSAADRMDYTVQKAVEAGVHHIQPVLSARCVARLSGERADKRRAHWQQIVVSTCEQCGRNRVPEVAPLISFEQAMTNAADPTARRLLLSPDATQRLRDLHIPAGSSITLLVGPEAGFTDQEEEQSAASGFEAVSLGPRIFRTETAALVAICALQAIYGDL